MPPAALLTPALSVRWLVAHRHRSLSYSRWQRLKPGSLSSGSPFLFAALYSHQSLRAPGLSSPAGLVQGHSFPSSSFPKSFHGPALYPEGWGSSCHSAFFSKMPASLLTSVSSRCAFKFDPRRNLKANFTPGDAYETCHCLCYYSTVKQRSGVPSHYMALLPFGLDAHTTQKTPDPEVDTSIHIHI